MTREDIVRMAWECGILMRSHEHQEEPTKIERFAALIAAHEREECAKLAEDNYFSAQDLAKDIRARGEKP